LNFLQSFPSAAPIVLLTTSATRIHRLFFGAIFKDLSGLAVEHSTQFVNSCQRKTALKAIVDDLVQPTPINIGGTSEFGLGSESGFLNPELYCSRLYHYHAPSSPIIIT